MNAKSALTWMMGALCTLAAVTSGAGLAQIRSLGTLGRLEAGSWELRVRDEPGVPKRLCLRDGRKLVQLRHRGLNCERLVVEDTASEITVQYTCPGRGYGRTQIRRESESLVQIDSQGIAEGLPFAFAAEARRIGSCTR
jgi:hypothetical protein